VREGTGTSGAQADYSIGALARRLGVASATLRDWERRYGLGPGGRTAGGHRRYQPGDITRIELMRRLVLDGVPPAEAARLAQATRAPAAAESAPGPGGPLAGNPAGGSGGRSLPLPGQLPQARGLARAALALDGPAIAATLDRSLDELGVVATWECLAVPVLTAIGQRNAATGTCVDVEHLLSAQLLAALSARTRRLPAPSNSRTVLLACADGEMHCVLGAGASGWRAPATAAGRSPRTRGCPSGRSRHGPPAGWAQCGHS